MEIAPKPDMPVDDERFLINDIVPVRDFVCTVPDPKPKVSRRFVGATCVGD
jgi:hypothetical protein